MACDLAPARRGPHPKLGLGTGELGGDALGLLQDRVEVLCLDQFVGLQMLEGPGAAERRLEQRWWVGKAPTQ